jgi:hypothetical protein
MVKGISRGTAPIGAPDRGKGSSSRPAQGRVCERDGCDTVLSTYNSSGTCWLHSEPTTRHSLARG